MVCLALYSRKHLQLMLCSPLICEKLTHNNPNLDQVKVNAYTKFDQIPSIPSQDIEWKRNFDNNQGT